MTRRTTDQYRQVDIREFERSALEPGASSSYRWVSTSGLDKGETTASISIRCKSRHRLRFKYTISPKVGSGEEDFDYPVSLDWTPCNFGGERPWFRCPGQGCNRRCAILYGGEVFVCRECRDLTYRRCQISGDDFKVARHKARKLANRYDGDVDCEPFLWSLASKPKGMHWDTWRDLLEEFGRAKERASHAMRSELQALVASLD